MLKILLWHVSLVGPAGRLVSETSCHQYSEGIPRLAAKIARDSSGQAFSPSFSAAMKDHDGGGSQDSEIHPVVPVKSFSALLHRGVCWRTVGWSPQRQVTLRCIGDAQARPSGSRTTYSVFGSAECSAGVRRKSCFVPET
ncbi:hypothetical protein DPEC_G00017750 [Dallia pectoralis]|uniref:Uncharacterized protein n=1 Tax=Dallia pectoralis TaxID=75939 RepID=A0ACC2HFA3_DALPE|nr:hypothetical protein DPEC_G00017750 [Dallia pectoralis]